MLGVHWTREQVQAMAVGKDKQSAVAPNEMMIPLAMGVNPDLMEGLKKAFRVVGGRSQIGGGEYMPGAGEQVVELGDLPREEWAQWIQGATPHVNEAGRKLEEMARPVNINEGKSDDPRIERIREQIERSKRW